MKRIAATLILLVSAPSAFALDGPDLQRMWFFAGASSSYPTSYFRFYAEDVADVVVTQWNSRVGSYAFTNYAANMLQAPWQSGGEICLMSNSAARGMRVSPALPCRTNMAFYFLMRRMMAGNRLVCLGNTSSSAVQGGFIFTDNALYSSLGFATQTKMETTTIGTNLLLIGVLRNASQQWARVNGVPYGTNMGAGAITHGFDQLGFIGASAAFNNATNRVLNIGGWEFDASPTTNDALSIEAQFKDEYPELIGVLP